LCVNQLQEHAEVIMPFNYPEEHLPMLARTAKFTVTT
jgi:hypothetical protein